MFERRDNVEGIFELQHPETLPGKHILIVDDVLTTGSTTLACASCLVDVEDIRISILTFGNGGNKYVYQYLIHYRYSTKMKIICVNLCNPW